MLLVQRWILARLRHRQFFALEELNAAIRALVIDPNARPFKKLEGSRQSAFVTIIRRRKPLLCWWPRAELNHRHKDFQWEAYDIPHLPGSFLCLNIQRVAVQTFAKRFMHFPANAHVSLHDYTKITPAHPLSLTRPPISNRDPDPAVQTFALERTYDPNRVEPRWRRRN